MVFEKAARTEVRQTILHSLFLHALRGDSTYAFICRHPDVAMPTLQERTYKIVRQLIRGGVVHYAVRCYVVGTASVCTHPQIALAVAKYISHHHVREFFEACRSRYAVSDSINSRSHGPQRTISGLFECTDCYPQFGRAFKLSIDEALESSNRSYPFPPSRSLQNLLH